MLTLGRLRREAAYLLLMAAEIAPIVAVAVAVLGGRRFERVQWVWPLAILAGYATSGVLVAIAVGGAHNCYT